MNDDKALGRCFGVILAMVILSAIFIIAPHVPSFNDDTESVEFRMGDDFVDVDIRMGDLDGYIGGIYRVGTAYMFSNMYVTPNDPTVDKVYALLNERMSGMTDYDKADYLLKFVQDNVRYVDDESAYHIWDYVQMPAETLYMGYGDCEDMAFLLYTLYLKAGLDAVVYVEPSHVSVGVNVPCNKSNYLTVDGKRYYSAESTGYFMIGSAWIDDDAWTFKPEIPLFSTFILILSVFGFVLMAFISRDDNDKTDSKHLTKNTIGV